MTGRNQLHPRAKGTHAPPLMHTGLPFASVVTCSALSTLV